MKQAFFLSASVPDGRAGGRWHRTADVIAIRDAVRALVTVVLPSGLLVWGGHPAITPLVRVVGESLGLTSGEHLRLYQSRYFQDQLPGDNLAFERVELVDAAGAGSRRRASSLRAMRLAMLSSERFVAGVFIGGMDGVEREYVMFRKMHPNSLALPIASTGGAALELFERDSSQYPLELRDDVAYASLFRRRLGIQQSAAIPD